MSQQTTATATAENPRTNQAPVTGRQATSVATPEPSNIHPEIALDKPVLEINPRHALVQALAKRYGADADKSLVEDAAWLLHDEARLMDGEQLADPAAFAARLTRVLAKAAS